MSMLHVGERAPDFTLRDAEDQTHALNAKQSPLTLALFFKTSCPTCHYAWPFYQRLHEAYAKAGLRVLSISQHDAEKTRAYRDQYHATFPHLLDEGFPVSQKYDPAFVPTGFLIAAQGNILETFESWNSARLNEFSERVARRLGVTAQMIVTAQDNARENMMG